MARAETARPRGLLIVNSGSRRGNDADLEPLIRKLEAANVAVEVARPSSAGDSDKLLLSQARNIELVILAGGDGTIRSAARALLQVDKPVAIVPLGTANDLARGLGIPADPAGAADVILSGRIRAIDVGMANDVPFFNAASIGLGPLVNEEIDADEKATWGVIAYARALWRALKRRRSFRVSVDCDGRRFERRVMQLTVVNGRHYGGGMTIDEDARLDDGRLDLVAIPAVGIPKLLKLGLRLRWGRSAYSPELITQRAARVHVTTRRTMQVSTDGDLTTETPVTFTVRPACIRVFVSPSAAGVESPGAAER